MSVRSKEELLNQINSIVGENSDDAISLIEDISDTIDDYETKVTGDGIDWKTKYEENDRNWRDKYTSRFFDKEDDGINNPKPPAPKKYNYDDLFSEKEN